MKSFKASIVLLLATATFALDDSVLNVVDRKLTCNLDNECTPEKLSYI